jgi:hypothetical protein
VRLVGDEVHRGRVCRDGAQGDDEVAERVVRLETAAGADPHQLLAAQLDQLLEDDRGPGTAHSGALDGHPLALPGAREAEQPPLLVHLGHVLEVRVGDVLGAQRVAGEEDGLGVVAGLAAEVDGHGRNPTRAAVMG